MSSTNDSNNQPPESRKRPDLKEVERSYRYGQQAIQTNIITGAMAALTAVGTVITTSRWPVLQSTLTAMEVAVSVAAFSSALYYYNEPEYREARTLIKTLPRECHEAAEKMGVVINPRDMDNDR
jgi:hypothetical protein